MSHLVLVNDPAFVLLIPPIVTAALFDKLIDGKVLEASRLGQKLTMAGLADTRRTSDNDIGLVSGHLILVVA